MYIIKNALISIFRNKGRNILIGVIILIIGCACTVTLAINNTANDLINTYQSSYDKELTISFNRKGMMQDFDLNNKTSFDSAKDKFQEIESYSIDDVEKFGKLDHINSYYYTYQISLNGSNIDKVEEEQSNNFPGRPNNNKISTLDFNITGYSNVDSMSEFISGKYKMSEITDDAWDIIFTGNYVFINSELASYNELSLNDTIKLIDEDNNKYSFEILGIFEETENEDDNAPSMFSSSVNTIITNASSVKSITDSNDDVTGRVNATFIIDEYDNSDTILQEFYDNGLNENYTVSTNEELATSGLSSIKNVKSFSITFLVITLIIGGTVLFIINMINIRERKYEIGVLRTIGISKFKLTMQFICELLLVSFVSLMLGALSGATMSKSVSNYLLDSEIHSSQEDQNSMKENFGMPNGMGENREFSIKGRPNVQAYNSINAVVNIAVILKLLIIGLSLVIVSSLASMISIQRFSPLTILKERS